MLIDGRELPTGENLEADLCIVGSGAAGLTLAREFAGTGTRVLVIESGGFEYEEEVQDLYNGEVVGLPYPIDEETRLRFFGGSTNHWGGMSRPFDAFSLSARDWVPHSGWPFGRDVLDQFYPKAGEMIEIGRIEPEAEIWAERLGRTPFPFDTESGLFNAPFQASPPTRFAESYGPDVLNADNVTVCLNTNLIEIVAHPDGAMVERLRLKTLTGVELTASARIFVLACGGIENARLLLLSNGVEKNSLGNRNDLVGRYFMEHAHFHLGEVQLTTDEGDPELYLEYLEAEGRTVYFHVNLSPEVQRREEVAFGSMQLRPSVPSAGEHSVRKLISLISNGQMPDDLGRHLKNIATDIGPVASWLSNKASHELFGTARYKDRLAIRSECEQVPDPENRVTLSEEKDALGLPRTRLTFHQNELDLRTLNVCRQQLAEAFGRQGFGRVQLPEDDGVPSYIQPGYHHIGTTRMAADPTQGVVTPNGRVHSVDNLYIAGSSVFPTSGDVTPTMTIVALALRLAEHLKASQFV
jgi:choline dehydrogenase-like flavoprotein